MTYWEYEQDPNEGMGALCWMVISAIAGLGIILLLLCGRMRNLPEQEHTNNSEEG